MNVHIQTTAHDHGVSLAEASRVWARIALLSFGGPAGQIAVMHRIVVDEKKWVPESRFLHALNYCMLLPGPEAQQLATYIGWLMHRTAGGLVAGGLFILPGVISIMALSIIYALWGNVGIVGGLFFGLKAAVLAIVIEAVARIGKRGLKSPAMQLLAAASFVGIFFFALPFPAIILASALIGYVSAARGNPAFVSVRHGAAHEDGESVLGDGTPVHAHPSGKRALQIGLIWVAVWLIPVVAILFVAGHGNVFSQIAVFFSKMAVVSFGGAYAVLAYVAQRAVETYHWLTPAEMLNGLGMAETTPGPLVMVLQFVGFMAAFRSPGDLPPLLAGVLGGLARKLGHLRALLSLDISRRAIHRKNPLQQGVLRRIGGDHRRRRRRHPEPRYLVRDPHHFSQDGRRGWLWAVVRRARARKRGFLESRPLGRCGDCDLPASCRRAPDPGGFLPGGNRAVSRRSDLDFRRKGRTP